MQGSGVWGWGYVTCNMCSQEQTGQAKGGLQGRLPSSPQLPAPVRLSPPLLWHRHSSPRPGSAARDGWAALTHTEAALLDQDPHVSVRLPPAHVPAPGQACNELCGQAMSVVRRPPKKTKEKRKKKKKEKKKKADQSINQFYSLSWDLCTDPSGYLHVLS